MALEVGWKGALAVEVELPRDAITISNPAEPLAESITIERHHYLPILRELGERRL